MKKTVLVTGIGGRLGNFLVKRLHREFNVLGIDRRKVTNLPKDVKHYKIDIRRSRIEDIFRENKIDTIFHLGVMHNLRENDKVHHDFNILGTTKLLEYAQKYGVKKFLFLSSANVYGPKATNSHFLSEDSPLMGGAKFSAIRDLIALDMLVSSFFWRAPKLDITIFRPAHILGNIRNAPSNYLRIQNRIPRIMGFDPMIQTIHQADLINAMIKVFKTKGVKGIFNIASKGELPLSEIIKYLGKKEIALPEPLFKLALKEMWITKLSSFPVSELDHIKYVCMVDYNRAIKAFDYKPKYSITDSLDSLTNLIF